MNNIAVTYNGLKAGYTETRKLDENFNCEYV